MAKFCTNCGKEIRDEDIFCPGCGTKAALEDTPVTRTEALEQSKSDDSSLIDGDTVLVDVVDDSKDCYAEQSSTYQPPVTEPEPQSMPQQPVVAVMPPAEESAPPTASPSVPVADPSVKVAGVGAFLGFEVLFSLPFIGWILCIVMSFVPKNKNLKNFARAKLIWILISALIFTACAVLLWILGNMLFTYIETHLLTWISGINWLPTSLSALEELIDELNEILSEVGYY